MFEKFLMWYSEKRKPIGITVAILAILAAMADFYSGSIACGTFQLVVAALVIHDVRTMQNEN